jgi:hypothetical protein
MTRLTISSLLFSLVVLALPTRADDDNWIQNGDFITGIDHWYGGGRSPADFANDNPLQGADPFTSKGLIVPLHQSTWIKVAQDFKGKQSDGTLTVTYKVSKDFAFSDKPDDYVNMPDKIGYDAWKAFNTSPGTWVVFLSDFGANKGYYYPLQPKLGSTDPQTYKARIVGMTPWANKTITLAFPPGAGTLVILSVSMTSDASE